MLNKRFRTEEKYAIAAAELDVLITALGHLTEVKELLSAANIDYLQKVEFKINTLRMKLEEQATKDFARTANTSEPYIADIFVNTAEYKNRFEAYREKYDELMNLPAEAKRLLKLAVEDSKYVLREYFGDICQFCKHYNDEASGCRKPHNGSGSWCCENAEWRYADAVKKLMGEDF